MSLTRVKLSSWDTYKNIYVNTLDEIYDAEKEGILFVSGRTIANDGQGGIYKYEKTAARSSHNGTSIIDPTRSGTGNGCWVRQKFFATPEGTNFSERQTANAGQQDFALSTFAYTPGEGALSIYVNGTRLTPDAFVEVDATSVQLVAPLKAGDVLEFIGHERPHGGAAVQMAALSVSYSPLASGLVSTDVQRALDELTTMVGTGGGTGGGGGASSAAMLAYSPLAPDTSANVQDAMHWIQNRIATHVQAIQDAHMASAIAYKNAATNLGVTNVQDAVDEIWQLAAQRDLRLFPYAGSIAGATNAFQALETLQAKDESQDVTIKNHTSLGTNAHSARAIFFNSGNQLYTGVTNVEGALGAISVKLLNHTHAAIAVTYDNSGSTLQAANVKNSLDELDQKLIDHKTALNSGHVARTITYSPIAGMSSTDVKGAIDELFTKTQNHEDQTTAAHAATAVSFNGVRYSLAATDVETAIIEAMTKRRMYQGHIDLSIPMPAGFTPIADAYYTQSVDGAVDPTWNSLFVKAPPATVTAGDYLLATATNLYIVGSVVPNQSDFVSQQPVAGAAQGIVVPDLTDTGLTISRIAAGSGAPLLDVVGDAIVDYLKSRSTVEDSVGNLRQTAGEVPFDPTGIQAINPGFIAADVQNAVDELYGDFRALITGTGNLTISSGNISFTPTGNITGATVSAALGNLDALLTAHIDSTTAHDAVDIVFNNVANGFVASDVQSALEEIPRLPAGGSAGAMLNKVDGQDFNVAWSSTITLGTF